MSITTLDDNKLIHFEVFGRGRPIVFLHDLIGSWRYWWPAMQGLARHHRSYALDLWGFGDSTKGETLYSINQYVDLLNQFIQKLEISRPINLVGHGLGAVVMLCYANKYPDVVDKLMLISLPVNGTLLDGRLLTTDLDSYYSRYLKAGHSEIESELRKTDQTAVNRLVQEIRGQDFQNLLLNAPVPILMLSGGQDPVVNQNGGFSQDNAADTRLTVQIDSCAHYPMLEEKAKFNRLLQEFIHPDSTLTDITLKEFWQRRVR